MIVIFRYSKDKINNSTYETANKSFSVMPVKHDAHARPKMRNPKKICSGMYDVLIPCVSPG